MIIWSNKNWVSASLICAFCVLFRNAETPFENIQKRNVFKQTELAADEGFVSKFAALLNDHKSPLISRKQIRFRAHPRMQNTSIKFHLHDFCDSPIKIYGRTYAHIAHILKCIRHHNAFLFICCGKIQDVITRCFLRKSTETKLL